jgi:hypothetical protein
VRLHALVLASASATACALSLVAGCEGGGDAPDSRSFFVTEDPYARQIEGRVVRGTEPVTGANVKITRALAFAAYERLEEAGTGGYATTSDLGGKYRVYNAPFFYDLAVRKDREVAVFENVAVRYFEPPLGADAPIRGYTARIVASTDVPPAPGNAIAYFVSGPAARTVRADGATLLATFRDYASVVTVHAVEYVASQGLAAPRAWGRNDVRVVDGGSATTTVIMNPIRPAEDAAYPTFETVVPPGFTLQSLDVVLDLGLRTNAQLVGHVPARKPWHLEVLRAARYFVRAVATGEGGAVSDSGLQYFNPFADKTTILLPRLVRDASFDPAAGLTAVTDDTFCEITPSISPKPACQSVVEHLLVPESPDGTTLRIATTDQLATVPDVTELGVPRPKGRYTWTVQQFPTLPRIDRLSGEDVRVMVPISTTAPRVIELP